MSMTQEEPTATPRASIMVQAKSEWNLDPATGSISRKLRGAELIVRASELTNNGNFQLNILGEFETTIPRAELHKRCQAAWWLTRQSLPLVGVTLGHEQASFQPIRSLQDARRWVSETCVFADGLTCEEVLLAQVRQASDLTKLTVILAPPSGRPGCVLNISHTLTSLDVYHIIASFVANLSSPSSSPDLERAFSPETAAALTPRLPASLGIPVHPAHRARASLVHNEQVRFSAAEAAASLAAARARGVSLTALFFACIAVGVAKRHARGGEDGAHLVFSGNARRWLGAEAGPPVGMSVLPGALWLGKASLLADDAGSPANVFAVARAIQERQGRDLASEHIVGVYDELAPTAFRSMMEASSASSHQPVVPLVSRPTLTSQGEFFQQQQQQQQQQQRADEGIPPRARLVHFRTGGRNTDPNVCFALYSFRGDMRCNLLFDAKYFDRDDVMALMETVMGIFRRAIFSVQDGGGGNEGTPAAKI
ncbi:hypothetical protein ISF_00890 [Cordyceps fumosorosea ARSEF 2679]|uniref:Condensation domain protein n=1 Tax=Cordyceps fumosorosea (strain ARSEF 2679) TaxID=1081104 RepID=A0A162N1H6_CORFA|nr:hypothetical protein ISF_00890 [Cordyceps fumosorosea ARSEF 2679]OAA73989.1 hypothetical protein ISF_00890 [Cordyceps fumosorosea ARSEF 2679]